MLDSFAPRDVAKFATTAVTGATVAYSADYVIESTTDIDTDNILVDATTTVFGALVALKLKPRTDALVDRVANARAIRKENRRNKKNAKNTES